MEKYPKKRAYAVGKLYKFLKEKGVYKQFVHNCKKQKIEKGQKNLENFKDGFLWAKTQEGFEFWEKLYDELWIKGLR
jgi:hypothetical protein